MMLEPGRNGLEYRQPWSAAAVNGRKRRDSPNTVLLRNSIGYHALALSKSDTATTSRILQIHECCWSGISCRPDHRSARCAADGSVVLGSIGLRFERLEGLSARGSNTAIRLKRSLHKTNPTIHA
jgi:hypothetical protein